MKISNIVVPVEPLSLTDTINQALERMRSKNVDIVPVADQQGGLVGAVTRNDLLSALRSAIPMTATIADRLSLDSARLKLDEEVVGVPGSAIPAIVLQDNGELAGVVTLEGYAAALQACITEFREQVSSIMNSATSGIIAIDEDGTIVVANRMAEDLLGIRAVESLGRNILDIIPNTRLMDIMKSG